MTGKDLKHPTVLAMHLRDDGVMGGCCLPGETVLTAEGPRDIETIGVGDLVLTHKGQYRRVLRTMSRHYDGTIYGLQAHASAPLWFTPEHPVLVADPRSLEREWVRADQVSGGRRVSSDRGGRLLTWNTMVVLPRFKGNNNTIDLGELGVVPLDHDLAYFLGLFVAEGSYRRNGSGKLAGIVFSLNDGKDRAFVPLVNRVLERLVGKGCRWYERPERHTLEGRCYSTALAKAIYPMCGSGAANKQIPAAVFSATPLLVNSFLDGLLDGDGHRRPGGFVLLRVASKKLAHGARYLAAGLGMVGRVTKRTEGADGEKTVYQAGWSTAPRYRRYIVTDDALYMPLRHVKTREYSGLVYNIEVEHDSSYVTQFAVHNCEQYRIRIPFEEIRDSVPGAVMDWAPIGRVREWASGGDNYKTKPVDYDMWLLPRHRPLPYGVADTTEFSNVPESLRKGAAQFGVELEGRAHLLDLVRLAKKKQVVVLEYDDDHWGSRDLGYYEHIDLAKELLSLADAVTVTTPYMRKLINKLAPGVPVYILPNCVKFSDWQDWERWDRWPKDWVVLGLTGSITHYDDWWVLRDVLPNILKENGNVALVLQGFVPDFLEELSVKFPKQVYADAMFRDYSAYPSIIRQADIVLCPVVPDDKFNWAKSEIKATEGYSAGRMLSNGKMGGAAVIASPLDYYKMAAGHGKRGVVVDHEPEAWYRAIAALVKDTDMRQGYQMKGRKWAINKRSIERNWHLWWRAYQEIYRRKRR